MRLLTALANKFIQKLDYIGGISALLIFSLLELFKPHKTARKLVSGITKKQILFTGYDALLIITVISLLLGTVIIVQAVTQLPRIGAEEMIGKILVIVLIRELAPIFTAIVVVGRSGTAISTEIGNMMVAHEFEALVGMGIDPLRLIVLPRLIGCVISMLVLTIYFNFIGIIGGLLTAKLLLGVAFSPAEFFRIFFQSLTFLDLTVAFIKSTLLGAIIAVVSVYHGFKVYKSPIEVPRATTAAVVNNLIFAFIINGILTVLFYI